MAVARGATVLVPAEVESVNGGPDVGWHIRLSTPAGLANLTAMVIVDAAGRSAPLAARLGARRQRLDRLACGWIEGQDRAEARARRAVTYLEAAMDGWWYTAAAGERRLVAFHTDADLPAAGVARDPARLMDAARRTAELGALLGETGFEPGGSHGFTAAHSAILEPCAGPGWVAAGDAAVSFDPISSQGLLNALVTGLAAAETAYRCLAGASEPSADYAHMVHVLCTRYRRNLLDSYTAVARWPASPFWARRRPGPMPAGFGPPVEDRTA